MYVERQSGAHFCFQFLIFIIIVAALFLAILPLTDPLHSKHYREKSWLPVDDTEIRYQEKDSAGPETRSLRCAVGSSWNSEHSSCERAVTLPAAVESDFLDKAIQPCEDFYAYACGGFVDDGLNAERDASFWYLAQNAARVSETIMEDVVRQRYTHPEHEADLYPSRLATFYKSCRDTASSKSETKGALETELLQHIADVQQHSELAALFGKLSHYDIGLPFRVSVELHPLHSTQKIVVLLQNGLPPESVDVVAERLQRGGESDFQRAAEHIVELGRSIEQLAVPTAARSIAEYVESGAAEEDLALLAPEPQLSFRVSEFVEAASAGMWSSGDALWLFRRHFFEMLPQLIQHTDVQLWKAYARYQLWRRMAEAESAPHPDEGSHSLTHGRSHESQLPWTLSSRISLDEESKAALRGLQPGSDAACSALTSVYMSSLLDIYYVKLGQQEVKKREAELQALNTAIHTTFADYIQNTVCELSEAGRAALASKVKSASVLLGAPAVEVLHSLLDGLRETASLQENVLAVHSARVQSMWAAFQSVPDLSWYHLQRSPQSLRTPNAYYLPQMNGVIVHEALLRSPFYSSDMSPVAQYARLGTLLAHEYAHSLDRLGTQHDNQGSPYNLFESSKRDRMVYEEALACISEQFLRETADVMKQLHRSPRVHVTLNEDIADVLGFRVAYEAAPIQGAEDARNFYLSYAQSMCRAMSHDEKAEFSALRAHSLPEVRVNLVAMGHPRFSDAWGCAASSKAAAHTEELQRCKLF